MPIVEIIEIKKINLLLLKRLKFIMKKKKPSSAPIASVQISNISKTKVAKKTNKLDKVYIDIGILFN